MGDFPIMTPSGTFIINGAERVIVSQIVRSPGVYYDKKTDKAYNSTYGTTVIPYHGAWLEYETDLNDIFNCRIDKNRKLPVTWFIKAMGAYKADNPNTWLSCIPDMRPASSRTSRSRKCSTTTRASSPRSTRTPATPARRRSSRSTASSARAIPRRSRARRRCLRACSMTAAATTFRTSAAISSTRSSACAAVSPALRWQHHFVCIPTFAVFPPAACLLLPAVQRGHYDQAVIATPDQPLVCKAAPYYSPRFAGRQWKPGITLL